MPVSAYTTGGEDYQRRLRGFAAQLVDLRPFWPTAAKIGRGWIKSQMDSQGAWGDEPWAPLTPAYAAWKARKYPGKPILWATRALRAKALSPRRVMGPQFLELIIEDPKAAYHQEGTSRMPARPIIPERMPATALDELRDAFDKHVDELIHRWGLRT